MLGSKAFATQTSELKKIQVVSNNAAVVNQREARSSDVVQPASEIDANTLITTSDDTVVKCIN